MMMAARNLYYFAGNWGGDPEIHIIFARNLLTGFPLQFNIGEFTSGETSVTYMALLALTGALFSVENLPWVMKGASLFALLALQIKLFRIQHKTLLPPVIALYIFSVPSIFFQTALGMENMLFAAFAVVYLSKFVPVLEEEPAPQDFWYVFTFLLLGMIGFLLRPEMVFVTTAVVLASLVMRRNQMALAALFSLLTFAGLLQGINSWTGVPLHGAGTARTILSQLESYELSIGSLTLFLNIKPIYFIWSAAPFLLIFGYSLFVSLRPRLSHAQITLIVLMVVAVFGPLTLHVFNILPNNHFSRYQLYLFFITAWLAVLSLRLAPTRPPKHSWMAICALAVLIFGAETKMRNLGSARAATLENLSGIQFAQSEAAKTSLSNRICAALTCAGPKSVTIAAQEVQIRLRLDERFVVRSLDGIVDNWLSEFVSKDGCFDHFGYLMARDVDVIWDFHAYSRRGVGCGPTLIDVYNTLLTGAVYQHGEMVIERLDIKKFMSAELFNDPYRQGFAGLIRK